MALTAQTHAPRTRPTIGSLGSLGYAVVAYASFLAVFAYAVPFLADTVVPRTIDHGGPRAGTAVAVTIDALLLGIFAVQHSLMARPAFKRRWTTLVPAHVERSTYVLAAAVVLGLVFWQWRPIPTVLWRVDDKTAHTALWVLFAAGWTLGIGMTFAIDHCDMFGLRQVARRIRGMGESAPAFRVPWPHRLVRHPMMVGFILAFLATPTMTASHLLFAILGCSYILVGVRLEERDLVEAFPQYRTYAATTPRFVPRPTALRGRHDNR